MIHRGSAHYRLSLAGGGTDLGEGEGLCITLSLPWRCHVVRRDVWCPHSGGERSITHDPDAFAERTQVPGTWFTDQHPILRHLTDVKPHHHFIVTHELPTRVGLGSSAALAYAATGELDTSLEIDRKATGAGWQDANACFMAACDGRWTPSAWAIEPDDAEALMPLDKVGENLLLFSTGGTHTEARNASELDPKVRELALEEARALRDSPNLEVLAWCMDRQWMRKCKAAPLAVCNAIAAASAAPGFIAAKSTGSRGAGFGVVLTKDRDRTRDALVECGARVWMP